MIMNVNFRTLERDRVEADFTVNKLVIEKERRRERGGGERVIWKIGEEFRFGEI